MVICDASFELQQIEVLSGDEINSEMKFICLSPIVVTTKKYHNGELVKYYYKPEDDPKEISEKMSGKELVYQKIGE